MTTCIAAACHHQGEPRIILCVDSKVSSDIWSSETEFKVYDLPPSPFVGLFANDVSQAKELLAIYKAHLAGLDYKEDEIQNELRKPIGKMKAQMVAHHVQRRLGIPYEEYLSRLDRLGESELWKKVSGELDFLNIDVELILAGFNPIATAGTSPVVIFRVVLEEVKRHQHFACIGAGLTIAEHVLHRRNQHGNMDMARTMYNVYEAKKESELAPSVGKTTTIIELWPAASADNKKPQGRIYHDDVLGLGRYYKRYGPREVKEIKFTDDIERIIAPPKDQKEV